MQQDAPPQHFDQQVAAAYDRQWAKLAPLRDAVQLLIGALLSDLRSDARILCVGAGTGNEILYLAQRFPQWHFTAVEPAAPMLEVCRRRAEEHGIVSRCKFHQGYLDSLPPTEEFDAATSLLVSQFILDRAKRVDFFGGIANRLRPGGYLASSDLASAVGSATYEDLLEMWLRMMRAADVAPDKLERLRVAYSRDVSVLPPEEVRRIIAAAGFDAPIQFFQAGLIHGCYAKRTR